MSSFLILHAEDDDNDAFFVQNAFDELGAPVTLQRAINARKAIEALSRDLRPNLLLLDMKMPGGSGIEVLTWVRAQPTFANLRVVMFTSSALPDDIEQARRGGADAYLVKPSELVAFSEIASGLLAALQANTAGAFSGLPQNKLAR